ncbi:LysM peptidoglycan-binding domain-containing protein [Oceanicella sp. SM1341]|uniref:LysM peptidoglycan-binding domain-containing protein n=1 Tax=Oceanicella sp. SM1341 TaxID=1548889 RepID=UPI000E4EA04F|nr:LysM peptidoglycan-binding domain-containing protein [Oceanicella sp. SM1341]
MNNGPGPAAKTAAVPRVLIVLAALAAAGGAAYYATRPPEPSAPAGQAAPAVEVAVAEAPEAEPAEAAPSAAPGAPDPAAPATAADTPPATAGYAPASEAPAPAAEAVAAPPDAPAEPGETADPAQSTSASPAEGTAPATGSAPSEPAAAGDTATAGQADAAPAPATPALALDTTAPQSAPGAQPTPAAPGAAGSTGTPAPDPQAGESVTASAAPPEATAPQEPPAEPGHQPSAAALVVPEFDLVRVEADGSTLIAGRAGPDVEIAVTFDGVVKAVSRTNSLGEFVAMVQAELKREAQEIRLISREGGVDVAVSSNAVLILALPPEEGAPEARPTVVKAGPEQVEILQPPHPGRTDQVVIDSISYDAEGEVLLRGRGRPGDALRIYVDGAPRETAAVAADGQWSRALPGLARGRYVLRVDALQASGQVVSRMEIPFQRDFPSAGALERQGPTRPSSVVVQPGNNLWTMARVHLGRGIRYTQIFIANRDRIRDPDLIYPGQIFDIPQPELSEP